MILALLVEGEGWPGVTIYGMPGVIEFVEAISDSQDADAVDAMLELVAEKGPPKNRHQCWKLGDGIFELKPRGVRLPFFWDPTRRATIVITHGFIKSSQRTPTRQVQHAKDQRTAVLKAQREKVITYD